MTRISIVALIFNLLFAATATAQKTEKAAANIDTKAQNVSGRVFDEKRHPLSFATLMVLSAADSSYITGAVSRDDGSFKLNLEEIKDKLLKVSCLGYTTLVIPIAGHDIGIIIMKPEAMNLTGVTINAQRPAYKVKAGALITTVQGTMLAKAGTANDVIMKLPGLRNGENGFEVIGKGSPQIYINGRRVHDLSELEHLGSGQIATVELNTNPGVRYESSVKAVINIRTVRTVGDGLSGNARLSVRQGYRTSTSNDASLNWRKGGIDVFGGMSYNFQQMYQEQKNNTVKSAGTDTWNMKSDILIRPRGSSFSGNIGFNWQINDKHSLGVKYRGSYLPFSNSLWYTGEAVKKNGATVENIVYDMHWNNNTNPIQHLNAYYTGQTGGLKISIDNDLYTSQSTSNQLITEQDDDGMPSNIDSRNSVRNTMDASKLTLTYKIGKGSVDVGGEAIFTNRHDRYVNIQEITPATDDHIKEKTYATFASYTLPLGKTELTAGARYEHVRSDYYEKDVHMAGQSRTYNSIYPTVNVSTAIGSGLYVDLSYKASPNRPTYSQLGSNVQYDDRYNYEKGNPLLRTATNHDITLSGVYRWIYMSFSWQYIKNTIAGLVDTYQKDSPISLFTNINYDHKQEYSAVLSLSPKISILSPRLNFSIMGQHFSITHFGENKKMNNPLLFVSFNNSLKICNGLTATVDMSYNTAGHINIVKLKESGKIDLGLRYDHKEWSLHLQATDILRTARNSMFTYGTQSLLDKWNYSDSQAVQLTMRLNFNTASSKYKGKGAGQSEINRL